MSEPQSLPFILSVVVPEFITIADHLQAKDAYLKVNARRFRGHNPGAVLLVNTLCSYRGYGYELEFFFDRAAACWGITTLKAYGGYDFNKIVKRLKLKSK